MIDRSGASALIPEAVSNILLDEISNESAALTLFRRIPMGTKTVRMPILSSLPAAYWVNGDTGLKGITKQMWANKYITAEEIAVIVPIPDALLDDASYDIWGAIRPRISEAVARKLDAAVFFGEDKPESFPTAIVPGAVTAGHVVERTTHTAANGGIAEDINDAFALVEEDGFTVDGIVASTKYRAYLRGARNADGNQLPEVSTGQAYGVDIKYPMRGLWPTGADAAEFVAGDYTHALLGVRQDITYKTLTEATLYDENGEVLYALAQQDMTALRVVARYGYQVANTIRYDNLNESTRYPWSVITSPGA